MQVEISANPDFARQDQDVKVEEYSKEMPAGWVQARYETATHILIGYLMDEGSEFRKRWISFNQKWQEAKGLEMRIKQQEIRHTHQGFGDITMREAVQRALTSSKSRAANTIDVLRLDKILVAENLSPLMTLDPRSFVAKTPGSKREARYRANGVPASITDHIQALKYIKDHGPPISKTASTEARGNRDPRIKAQRCLSEWTRWIEVKALDHLLEQMAEDMGAEVTEESREALLAMIRS